jgi:hypothetical protein
MKTYSLSILMLISLSSCSLDKLTGDDKNVELVPVVINNEYSVDIPSFMTKTTKLNDDASLQFQNIFKEAYIIVIDESKAEFVDALVEAEQYDSTISVVANYADTQFQLTSSSLDIVSRTDISTLRINGLNAARVEMDARVEGISQPVSYFLTFIESREKLYMIMAWTLTDKKETHRKTFERMAKTFKSIHEKPLAIR